MEMKTGVIALPNTGTFNDKTTISLLSLFRPANTNVIVHAITQCLVYDARDQAIDFAEQHNADWILFVDSDMVLPYDALIKLEQAHLIDKETGDKETLDIIGGACFKRLPPYQPCFYTKCRIDPDTKQAKLETLLDFPDRGYLEVEGMGLACCFIRKNAWRKIKEKTSQLFFPYPQIGEDLSFCIRARMAQIKMYVDLSINVGHIGETVVTKETYANYRDSELKRNPKKALFV